MTTLLAVGAIIVSRADRPRGAPRHRPLATDRLRARARRRARQPRRPLLPRAGVPPRPCRRLRRGRALPRLQPRGLVHHDRRVILVVAARLRTIVRRERARNRIEVPRGARRRTRRSRGRAADRLESLRRAGAVGARARCSSTVARSARVIGCAPAKSSRCSPSPRRTRRRSRNPTSRRRPLRRRRRRRRRQTGRPRRASRRRSPLAARSCTACSRAIPEIASRR